MPDTDFELAHAPVADPEAVRAAVQDAVRFGPYFGWHVGPVTTVLSRRELHEPTQLRSLLDAVGVSVGSDEGRVVASTLHYGFAARCWSLTLGVWQRGGVVLDLDGLGYVVNPSGSVDLTLNDFRGWDGSALSASEVADVMAATVIADQFEGFHTALRAVARVADGLLWGNAASALSSGARRIAAGRSDDRVTPVATALLARHPLAGKMTAAATGPWRRNTCCLWYRTRDHTKCGDCPLVD
ncbi:hypothetical protein MCHIJ_13130 [Mycolicibacterium chitae]|uniref:ABC transporter n=1 Tax=Mycolicibacterium chitae TaxID=1792 RepID=A0A3S4VG20_MYCCI|nr:(2Fe-2S)-binding protein [Mycolicibacterium chitae]MCV7104674.1 (2Fe-2S)-binding protein [Mycolicibacterium chitae]BBZ01876.1 hypothetical protein MCHIJ_13130 [Mycolicibacterium chitae]VEG50704.1 ABC transporter [Mycolicibacterium chitae]